MPLLFSSDIQLPSAVKLGEPILVRFTLTNLTDDDYFVLKWFTPLEGLESPCLSVTKNGISVPYDGKMKKRASIPPATAYVELPARGTIIADFDLSEVYSIDTATQYTVSVATEVHDYVKRKDVHNLAMHASHAATAPSRHMLSSATHSIDVLPGPGPKSTISAEFRKRAVPFVDFSDPKKKPSRAFLLGSGFEGGTPAQQATAQIAFSTAYQMIYSAHASINSGTYNTWFGDPGSGRRDRVDSHFNVMKDGVRNAGTGGYPGPIYPPLIIVLTGDGCSPGDFAYTRPGSRHIWLCGNFWTAPATGTDSQAGTFVHELSHEFAGTADIVYGVTKALNLAATDPENATNNADNHEYFAENIPLIPVGPYGILPTDQPVTSTGSPYHR